MALPAVAVALISQAVGLLVQGAISLISGPVRRPDSAQTLETLLEILSKDFSSQVTKVIEHAMVKHEVNTYKDHVMTSIRLFGEYRASLLTPGEGDIESLAEAKNEIIKAIAILKRYCADNLELPSDRKKNTADVKNHCVILKSLTLSLIATVNIYILIEEARAKSYPGLWENLSADIDDFSQLALLLANALTTYTPLRYTDTTLELGENIDINPGKDKRRDVLKGELKFVVDGLDCKCTAEVVLYEGSIDGYEGLKSHWQSERKRYFKVIEDQLRGLFDAHELRGYAAERATILAIHNELQADVLMPLVNALNAWQKVRDLGIINHMLITAQMQAIFNLGVLKKIIQKAEEKQRLYEIKEAVYREKFVQAASLVETTLAKEHFKFQEILGEAQYIQILRVAIEATGVDPLLQLLLERSRLTHSHAPLLHLALKNASDLSAKALLGHGIDAFEIFDGQSAIVLARERGFEEVVFLLQDKLIQKLKNKEHHLGFSRIVQDCDLEFFRALDLPELAQADFPSAVSDLMVLMAIAITLNKAVWLNALRPKLQEKFDQDLLIMHYAKWPVYTFLQSEAGGEVKTLRFNSEDLLYHININAHDAAGNTALHRAVQNKNSDYVSKLLAHNADITLTNNAGLSAKKIAQAKREFYIDQSINIDQQFMVAVQRGDIPLVRKYIAHGANINTTAFVDQGGTALHEAIQIEDATKAREVVVFLLNARINFLKENYRRQNALSLATKLGKNELATLVREFTVAHPELEREFAAQPRAQRKCDEVLCRQLVHEGGQADPEIYRAVREKRQGLLAHLLSDHQIDASLVTLGGQNPYMLALSIDRDLARIVVNLSLPLAVRHGWLEAVRYWLEKGAKLNEQHYPYKTPLLEAVVSSAPNKLEALALLLNQNPRREDLSAARNLALNYEAYDVIAKIDERLGGVSVEARFMSAVFLGNRNSAIDMIRAGLRGHVNYPGTTQPIFLMLLELTKSREVDLLVLRSVTQDLDIIPYLAPQGRWLSTEERKRYIAQDLNSFSNDIKSFIRMLLAKALWNAISAGHLININCCLGNHYLRPDPNYVDPASGKSLIHLLVEHYNVSGHLMGLLEQVNVMSQPNPGPGIHGLTLGASTWVIPNVIYAALYEQRDDIDYLHQDIAGRTSEQLARSLGKTEFAEFIANLTRQKFIKLVESGDADRVRRYIEAGIKAHPLHVAYFSRQWEILNYLLVQGANPFAVDAHYKTVMDYAKLNEQPDVIAMFEPHIRRALANVTIYGWLFLLFQGWQNDVLGRSDYYDTNLARAIERNDLDKARKLLDFGVVPRHAVMAARLNGPAMHLLLDYGANPVNCYQVLGLSSDLSKIRGRMQMALGFMMAALVMGCQTDLQHGNLQLSMIVKAIISFGVGTFLGNRFVPAPTLQSSIKRNCRSMVATPLFTILGCAFNAIFIIAALLEEMPFLLSCGRYRTRGASSVIFAAGVTGAVVAAGAMMLGVKNEQAPDFD